MRTSDFGAARRIFTIEAGAPANRRGWWLIGLAAIYLALAWALRRLRLPAYATDLLIAGFALVALGLPPSSGDQMGALVGYGAAALLYAVPVALIALFLHSFRTSRRESAASANLERPATS